MLHAVVLLGVAVGLTLPGSAALAEPSAAEIEKRIEKSSTELEKVVESYNKINEELKQTKKASKDISAKLMPLEQELAKASEDIAGIAARAYKDGHIGAANALLTGMDSDSLIQRLGMLDQLARDRQQQVAGYTATTKRFQEQRQALTTTEARQAAQSRELAARKKKIERDLDKLYDLRRAAFGSPTSAGSTYSGAVPNVSGKAGVAVRFAYSVIGSPYVWAGEGPGYDCSGLTLVAWRKAGKSLPHNAAMQWNVTSRVSRSQLMPGDLVFYNGLQHVGIYVGSGKIIHAPTFGESVKLASVDVMPPYGYGRV